jgi:hypothetical protein
MRTIISSTFIVICAASSAVADTQKTFETAAFQVALAANCRASYGDHELFEVVFENFAKAAQKAEVRMSDEEIIEAKQELYKVEAESGENPFMYGFCKELREKMLPE